MSQRAQRTVTVLEQIRDMLLQDAAADLAWADQYRTSKRMGERNSTRIYIERGQASADAALMLTDRIERA
jgi:hypothetical protein